MGKILVVIIMLASNLVKADEGDPLENCERNAFMTVSELGREERDSYPLYLILMLHSSIDCIRSELTIRGQKEEAVSDLLKVLGLDPDTVQKLELESRKRWMRHTAHKLEKGVATFYRGMIADLLKESREFRIPLAEVKISTDDLENYRKRGCEATAAYLVAQSNAAKVKYTKDLLLTYAKRECADSKEFFGTLLAKK